MSYNYNGFSVKQRGERSEIEFITFIANAKDVYNWAHADSILIDKSGVQRKLTKSRWNKIKKFFETNNDNIIPNSIIVACDEEILPSFNRSSIECEQDISLTNLKFDDSVKEHTFIIDGQHRLKGMSKLTEDIPVVVSLFLGISNMERAFQFITINNKSHKVPTDNIKALVSNFHISEEETLKNRLSTASITAGKFATLIDIFNEDKESPFYQRVDWENNRLGKRIVKPLAIENSLKVLLKNFPNLKDAKDDVLIDILYSMWNPILNIYSITDTTIEEFINLFKKATIQAISEFVTEKIADKVIFATDAQSINYSEVAKELTEGLFSGIPETFWKEQWEYTSLDTDTGRKFIIESLTSIKRNLNTGVAWNTDIKLVKEID